jgi:methanogenic corrinoid protein MtbC1
MSREEMPMQGMHEAEVILAGAVIEVDVVDVGGK